MAPVTNGGDGYGSPFIFCSFLAPVSRCGAKAGAAKTETPERANKLAKDPSSPFPQPELGVRYFDLKVQVRIDCILMQRLFMRKCAALSRVLLMDEVK